jgi:ATP-binding cassette subfamily F protein 3
MIATHLDQISFSYISEPVFDNLTWKIHDDRCVGFIGPNGCGKSTLLKIIAGQINPDSGFISRSKVLDIGYLPQELHFEGDRDVLSEVLTAIPEVPLLEYKLTKIEEDLSDPDVYGDEKRLAHTLDQQEKLLQDYVQFGGPGFEGNVRATLFSMGFSEAELELPISVLSGGQKKLLGLAKLVLTRPGLLLLDEPDNHLDIRRKNFLEEFIRSYSGGVILVSHDRFLLDLVVDEVVELEDGAIVQYPGNYSEYAFEKQLRLQRQQQLFQAQQKEINRLEQSANRLLTWGKIYDNEKFIRRGKNILKRLERMERIDKPVLDRKTMDLEIKGWRGSNKVLEITDLVKGFTNPQNGTENSPILSGLDLLIWRGERVGLVGPNGAGKTLLFRLILGEEFSDSGSIVIGPSVTIGYYSQHHETLDYNLTLIDMVRQNAPLSETRTVAFLNRFLFSYSQQRGYIKELSGGERSRLQLALLMLSEANFLLLDEPTNNLDIPSAEVLESALDEFDGTLLVISHDRYFLDRVVDRIVELDAGSLTNYHGGYSEYFAARSVSPR